jgi:hypothetical protein
MKTKLLFAIAAAAALPIAGIAADASDTQDAQLNKLLSEMNSAPSDQKISAIVTLLNKLVEERKAAPEQAGQQTPAPKKEMGMCMCCDMMKSDQSGQQNDQSEHSHH